MLKSVHKKPTLLFGLIGICLFSLLPVATVAGAPGDYAPRPAKEGRTVILHGDFSRNGADKSLIVIPDGENGDSKTVPIGGNAHSSVGGWDSIEMDCFNPERGYYKTTLRLRGGVHYQFKMEQKNSGGIKDVWYGLDGYMSRHATDPYNGGSDANINLFLKHDDDVTFFFIDGDRGSFVEWQPAPPHPDDNQPGTKFHLISVATKIRDNLQGLEQNGNSHNIFDNNARGSWRWRDGFSPVWYSLTDLPASGEIGADGTDISATGALYMFRRTDVGEIGMYGKWQLDHDIANPAQDHNSDYWKNAGAFFSDPANAPKLNITDANGRPMHFPLDYADDEKQPRHEEGANNIIFEGASTVRAAGVYTYYWDAINLDGTLTDDAQNFAAYPRHPAQSVYLPTITLDAQQGTRLSGQVHGYNPLQPEQNVVYILLTNGEGQRQIHTASVDAQGAWQLDLSLPNGSYTANVFADVFTPQLIDPLARNFSNELYAVEGTADVDDLNTSDGYAGQAYLRDFIAAQNAPDHYAAFGDGIPASDRRIYEVDGAKTPVPIGTSFSTNGEGAGTHTRSRVAETTFTIDNPIPTDMPTDTPMPSETAPDNTVTITAAPTPTQTGDLLTAPPTGDRQILRVLLLGGTAGCAAIFLFAMRKRKAWQK